MKFDKSTCAIPSFTELFCFIRLIPAMIDIITHQAQGNASVLKRTVISSLRTVVREALFSGDTPIHTQPMSVVGIHQIVTFCVQTENFSGNHLYFVFTQLITCQRKRPNHTKNSIIIFLFCTSTETRFFKEKQRFLSTHSYLVEGLFSQGHTPPHSHLTHPSCSPPTQSTHPPAWCTRHLGGSTETRIHCIQILHLSEQPKRTAKQRSEALVSTFESFLCFSVALRDSRFLQTLNTQVCANASECTLKKRGNRKKPFVRKNAFTTSNMIAEFITHWLHRIQGAGVVPSPTLILDLSEICVCVRVCMCVCVRMCELLQIEGLNSSGGDAHSNLPLLSGQNGTRGTELRIWSSVSPGAPPLDPLEVHTHTHTHTHTHREDKVQLHLQGSANMKRRRVRRRRSRFSPCRTHYTQQNICSPDLFVSDLGYSHSDIGQQNNHFIWQNIMFIFTQERILPGVFVPLEGGAILRLRSRVRLRFVFANLQGYWVWVALPHYQSKADWCTLCKHNRTFTQGSHSSFCVKMSSFQKDGIPLFFQQKTISGVIVSENSGWSCSFAKW